MIGLVLVTHGPLATALVSALEHIVGEQPSVATVCIEPDDDMEARRADIVAAVETVGSGGDGVIVLTDMFGGTPSNISISVMKDFDVEVIAGVNLPMLIQLAQVRNTHTLDAAVIEAQEAGRKYINVASQLLADRDK